MRKQGVNAGVDTVANQGVRYVAIWIRGRAPIQAWLVPVLHNEGQWRVQREESSAVV